MTVSELIKALEGVDGNTEVVLEDGNGFLNSIAGAEKKDVKIDDDEDATPFVVMSFTGWSYEMSGEE